MGDHRISLKITFEMHGHKDELDAWWNFTEHDVPGVDYRVIEWLQEQYDEAMSNYMDAQCATEIRQQAETENVEREMLAKLKTKYEP